MYRFRKQKLDLLILVEDSDLIKLYMHRFVEALTKVNSIYKACIQSLSSQAYSEDKVVKCEKAIFVLNNTAQYSKKTVEICATGLKGKKASRLLLTFGNAFIEQCVEIFLPENSTNAASVEEIELWLPNLICFIFPKCRSSAGNKYYMENRCRSESCEYLIDTSMAKMGAVKENTYNEHCRCKIYILHKNTSPNISIQEHYSVRHNSVKTVVLVDAYAEVPTEDSKRTSQRVFSLLTIIHCILYLADNLLIHPDRFYTLRIGLWRMSQWCQGLPKAPARLVDHIEESSHRCKWCRIYLSILGLVLSVIGTGISYWYNAEIEANVHQVGRYEEKTTLQIHYGLFSVCTFDIPDCYNHETGIPMRTYCASLLAGTLCYPFLLNINMTLVLSLRTPRVPGWLITTRVMSIISVVSVFLALVLSCVRVCCYKHGSRKIATLSVFLEAFGGLASVLALAKFGANYQDLMFDFFYYDNRFWLDGDFGTVNFTYISGSFHASFGLNIIATFVFFLNVAVKLKLLRCCSDMCNDCDRVCDRECGCR